MIASHDAIFNHSRHILERGANGLILALKVIRGNQPLSHGVIDRVGLTPVIPASTRHLGSVRLAIFGEVSTTRIPLV